MRKITALILATVLVLSMGIGVLARYEVCSECGGRLVEKTVSKFVRYEPCSKSGDPDMKDKVYHDYLEIKCSSCGSTVESDDLGERTVCNH